MTLDELRQSIDKATPPKVIISTFDLDFLAHAYLVSLYQFKVDRVVPTLLNNVKQLIKMGAIIKANYSGISEELREFIPVDIVPLKRELEHRWVASKVLNMATEELKPRVQGLL